MISCSDTSTETQSSDSAATAFCAAMKRASAAPELTIWFIIATVCRCVMMPAVSAITTATIRPIMAAHFTRSGTMRGWFCLSSASSMSVSTLPSAFDNSSPF